jgi:hypothetical protein
MSIVIMTRSINPETGDNAGKFNHGKDSFK